MNTNDVVKAIISAIFAALSFMGYSNWATGLSEPPVNATELISPVEVVPTEPAIVECSTDLDCAEKNPHVPEPGHEESDICDEPSCDTVSVPSVSEGLGSLGYLPCQNEDGPGPCFWDAQNMGDGNGRSFVILSDNETYIYLD